MLRKGSAMKSSPDDSLLACSMACRNITCKLQMISMVLKITLTCWSDKIPECVVLSGSKKNWKHNHDHNQRSKLFFFFLRTNCFDDEEVFDVRFLSLNDLHDDVQSMGLVLLI